MGLCQISYETEMCWTLSDIKNPLFAGKSGKKRKKDKNSPNSGADTRVNKRTMADSFNYSLSPTGLTQTQAS